MLEYRVLGALQARRDGEELHVGGPRQRRLLAALLLHRDEVVSSDRLVQAVFAGSPTPNAASTLRTYVLRLRRVLDGEDAEPALATKPPGYALQVAEDAVDAARFERLVSVGRSRQDKGDPSAAAAAFQEALDLWAGEPYAEFAGEPWVQLEAQRLEQLRSLTEEQLISAQLDGGLAGELVPRLEAMVERDPLRESVRAQLVVALYRSGRQADALTVLREYREVLGEETGLYPAPELQQLEQRVLVHDDGLRRAGPPARVVRGYRLGERLGSGRDGTVHAARLPGVDRDLVIRVVPREIADRPDVVRSFDAAMRRVASLHHDAIVPIDDHWREPGGAWVVLRRMRGGTLRDRLDAGGIPLDEALELLRRIGSALAAAAERGIVHGRVIPESVLFDESGAAHLSDFPVGEVEVAPADDVVAFAALVQQALTGHRAGPPQNAAQALPVAQVLGTAASSEHPPTIAELLSDVERALGGRREAGRSPNPYKGLRAFDEADAADFFGREELISELLDRLGTDGSDKRLVLVVGASGSGKSSVVRAGLLPRVRAGAIPGSDRWLVTTMTPGATPFGVLEDSLGRVATASGSAGPSGPELAGQQPPLGDQDVQAALHRVVPEGNVLLLVIDQLEELFTLADEEVQRSFLDEVAKALSAPDSRLRVVATLRADYYDRPLRFRGFGELVRDATVTVPAMRAAQLEATITGPADRVGLEVEPSLVAELVAAVVDQPAAMPSLQFTLYELAESGNRGLDLAAYRQLGGVGGAIASRAENLYRSIDDGAVIRRVFEQLVLIGGEGELTRRPAARSELARLAAGRDVDEVIEAWVRARLLQRDRHPDTREPTIEVAHEALLREWPRLRGWIDADRAAIVAAGQLREAARSWESLERDPGALYRGAKLETAQQLLGGQADTLPDSSRAFLAASRDARDQRRAQEAERALGQARTNRRLRRQLAGLAVAMVVAVVGGFVAIDQRQQAREDRRVAVVRELVGGSVASLEEDPELGILLALEAVDRTRSTDGTVLAEVENALHRAVTAHRKVLDVPDVGGRVDWHPDGTLFVAEGPAGTGLVEIRDAVTGASVLAFTAHDADITDVAFSGDGALLATTGADGFLRVWDARTGELRTEVGGSGEAEGVSFSPDGSRVAAAWEFEAVVRVLELTDEGPPVVLTAVPPELGSSTSFSPDGERLAITALFGVFVVDVADDEVLFNLGLETSRALSVAWSPDGRQIATSSERAVVRIADAVTGAPHASLTGHTGDVLDIAWSPDSSRVATGSEDGSVRVFEVTEVGAVEETAFSAGDGAVIGVAFSPDGDRLLTGDDRVATASIWDVGLSAGAEWMNLPTSPGGEPAAAFTPDGESVIVSGSDVPAVTWDLDTATATTRLGQEPPAGGFDVSPPAWAIDVSPDGDLVATISGEWVTGRAHVWDASSGAEAFPVEFPSLQPGQVAWSPDGDLLAVTGDDRWLNGRIGVVDRAGRHVAVLTGETGTRTLDVAFTADGRRLVTVPETGPEEAPVPSRVQVWDLAREEVVTELQVLARAVAADPASMRIAVAHAAGGASVWDADTAERVTDLVGYDGEVHDLAFSADGMWLATAGDDGTVRVWAAETGRERLVLEGHDEAVSSAAFNPAGDRLVSTSTGIARVWALDLDDLVEIAESKLTRSLTDDECRQYLHTETCPERAVGRHQ